MTDNQRQTLADLLNVLALIEENFGYVFKGTDEWRELARCRQEVRAMIRKRGSK